MQQQITVDGHCYTLDTYEGGVTVWTPGNRLVCDVEYDHNTESASVTYRDGTSNPVNYWEFMSNVDEMGLQGANEEAARWAISVEE